MSGAKDRKTEALCASRYAGPVQGKKPQGRPAGPCCWRQQRSPFHSHRLFLPRLERMPQIPGNRAVSRGRRAHSIFPPSHFRQSSVLSVGNPTFRSRLPRRRPAMCAPMPSPAVLRCGRLCRDFSPVRVSISALPGMAER